jgi:hypothetical protein
MGIIDPKMTENDFGQTVANIIWATGLTIDHWQVYTLDHRGHQQRRMLFLRGDLKYELTQPVERLSCAEQLIWALKDFIQELATTDIDFNRPHLPPGIPTYKTRDEA